MKFKYIFTLLILFSTDGVSQFYDFKDAYHFYVTNQQEAFEYSIRHISRFNNCKYEYKPD